MVVTHHSYEPLGEVRVGLSEWNAKLKQQITPRIRSHTLPKMATLVVYVFHEHTENVRFFLAHGIQPYPETDWVVVINQPTLSVKVPPYVRVINRENKGWDFGGWSCVLSNLSKPYDYYILLNSSVRGPFLPRWCTQPWTTIFTGMLNDEVKLAGTLIGLYFDQPHVESMLLAFDKVGLKIGIDEGIFDGAVYPYKSDIVIRKEIAFSTHVIRRGYNIDCLAGALGGLDYRALLHPVPNVVPYLQGAYCGVNVLPEEIVFIKSESHPIIADRLAIWHEKRKRHTQPQRYHPIAGTVSQFFPRDIVARTGITDPVRATLAWLSQPPVMILAWHPPKDSQIIQTKEYGVDGFVYEWPLHGEPKASFCLSWTNGASLCQVSVKDWKERLFKHRNYIRRDGKPLLIVPRLDDVLAGASLDITVVAESSACVDDDKEWSNEKRSDHLLSMLKKAQIQGGILIIKTLELAYLEALRSARHLAGI